MKDEVINDIIDKAFDELGTVTEESIIDSEKIQMLFKAWELIDDYVLGKYGLGHAEAPEELIHDMIPCPSCNDGDLIFTMSNGNRHIHANCNKCELSWKQ